MGYLDFLTLGFYEPADLGRAFHPRPNPTVREGVLYPDRIEHGVSVGASRGILTRLGGMAQGAILQEPLLRIEGVSKGEAGKGEGGCRPTQQ